MSPLAMTAAVIGLGLGGFDPFGALIVLPAIAAGARRRAVAGFFLSAAVVTIATGLVLGESVQYVTRFLADAIEVPDPVRLMIQAVAAVGIGVWAWVRWHRRNAPQKQRSRPSRLVGMWPMTLAGVLWGISALTDPTFYGAAALSATTPSAVSSAIIFTAWFLISQLPLCLVVTALALGQDSALFTRVTRLVSRLSTTTAPLLTILLAATSFLLFLNAGTYLVTGEFSPF